MAVSSNTLDARANGAYAAPLKVKSSEQECPLHMGDKVDDSHPAGS